MRDGLLGEGAGVGVVFFSSFGLARVRVGVGARGPFDFTPYGAGGACTMAPS
jgi:hypothetical protein